MALNDVTVNGVKTDVHGDVWRDYKNPLKDASGDKCWYCEIKQERSDNAVDHFRPKDHYWWSAFSAENFRYSCTYCNSRRKNSDTGETEGKGNKFPLLDETIKATCQAEERNETPMLLDPCRPREPGFLDFNEDGLPMPKFSEGDIRYDRAIISIELYHLDNPDIVDKRRVLAAQLKEKIDEGADIYDRCDQGDQAIDSVFDGILAFLARALLDRAELSTFSRRVISGHREKEWVEILLATT